MRAQGSPEPLAPAPQGGPGHRYSWLPLSPFVSLSPLSGVSLWRNWGAERAGSCPRAAQMLGQRVGVSLVPQPLPDPWGPVGGGAGQAGRGPSCTPAEGPGLGQGRERSRGLGRQRPRDLPASRSRKVLPGPRAGAQPGGEVALEEARALPAGPAAAGWLAQPPGPGPRPVPPRPPGSPSHAPNPGPSGGEAAGAVAPAALYGLSGVGLTCRPRGTPSRQAV